MILIFATCPVTQMAIKTGGLDRKYNKLRFYCIASKMSAGKKPCNYWAMGRCIKGNDCGFSHDGPAGSGKSPYIHLAVQQHRRSSPDSKTPHPKKEGKVRKTIEGCKFFTSKGKNGGCKHGTDCTSPHQLSGRSGVCMKFVCYGKCPHDNCKYLHNIDVSQRSNGDVAVADKILASIARKSQNNRQ